MKRAGAGAVAKFGAKLDLLVATLPRRNPIAFGKPDERCPLGTKSPFHEKLVSGGTGPQFASSFVALNEAVPEATLPLVKRVIPVDLVAPLEVAAVHFVTLGTGNRRMLSSYGSSRELLHFHNREKIYSSTTDWRIASRLGNSYRERAISTGDSSD